ncbi:MAG: HpaII family restriction endonuclease [Rikenellaceae bacterium]
MSKFTFIDLFAGIGGFHIAMHRLGGECVFASEIDKDARITYEKNFSKISPHLFTDGLFNDDIRAISPCEIPDFDVLCAGFPCQPFSQAGYKRGFDDNHKSERGNLFFNIAEIIEIKRPKAFFLENVRGLVSHDNGNTYNTIRNILENELGYSVYLQIVSASDYGLPQRRPRAFIIGFRDEEIMKSFTFPSHTKLKFTMSEVWGGNCTRDIGYTLRVGGRGCKIDDRRNWDSYLVDGEIRRLTPTEGKMMQGFPNDFILPNSSTQAMKQLGNSVAIDAVESVGRSMIKYMDLLNSNKRCSMKETKNKGEWSELYVFIQAILNKQIPLGNSDLSPKSNLLQIKKVTNHNIDRSYYLDESTKIDIIDKHNGNKIDTIDTANIITPHTLDIIKSKIKDGNGSLHIEDFDAIQNALGLSIVKGGTSDQKADIVLDVESDKFAIIDEGYGIKSYLGNKPTLFNASGSTNFIYKISGLTPSLIDEINNISSRTKIVDRINAIENNGGSFHYVGAENKTLNNNLIKVDGDLPQIIGKMLLCFYKLRISPIAKVVENICSTHNDKLALQIKVKRLLLDMLLGFFPSKEWDGEYGANGTIVVKQDGNSVAFHIIDQKEFKEYLYENIKFDTPSSTRHRFGKIYLEKDGNLYFKLNMQLRFK